MSQKHTLNSLALAAVLALAVFVVAFALFMFIADYRIMGSLFMALMIALFAGIVLFLGFGTPNGQPVQAVARAAPVREPAPAPTPSPAAAPKPAEDSDAVAEADAEAEMAKLKAAEAAAREQAEADAARQAAEAEKAAAAEATPDYDGDGVREGAGEGTRPAGLDAPRDGTADDLKQIKGIGPKLEKLCNSLGFWHFDQVAAWTSDEVAWVDANLEGFKGRVTRDKWVDQAKVLASGGETEFSKRVEDGDVY
jgi:predicted flap endonuclease-1-like 5' DNA nuclease